MFVRGVAPLGDDAFPPFGAGAIPGLVVDQHGDARERHFQWKPREQRAPLDERQARDVTSVEPHDVEHVIARAGVPCHLSVEHELARRQRGDGVRDCWQILRKAVARQQPHAREVLEREQVDAVELALEGPLGPVKRS